MLTDEFISLSRVTENPVFLDKMIKGDAVGEAKYGDATKKPPELLQRFLKAELDTLKKDGNHEHLVNAANYCCYLSVLDESKKIEYTRLAYDCMQQFDESKCVGTDSSKSVHNDMAIKTISQHLREIILGEDAMNEY